MYFKTALLYISVKKKFDLKSRSKCNSAVFVKRFYFVLVRLINLDFPRIFKEVKRKFSENDAQNICRLFHHLEKSLFTTSESKPDYYHHHQKAILPISSRVAERRRILGNQEISKKSLKTLELTAIPQPAIQILNFDRCARKLQNIYCKSV